MKRSGHALIAGDFEKLSRDELHERLTWYIFDLLVNQPEKLVNLMYRHDVKESLFRRAFILETVEEQAAYIADLVIDRELQKVAMRKAFKKEKLSAKNNKTRQ